MTASFYTLVASESCTGLEERVREHLQRGWQLYGPPVISRAIAEGPHRLTDKTTYAQALILTNG